MGGGASLPQERLGVDASPASTKYIETHRPVGFDHRDVDVEQCHGERGNLAQDASLPRSIRRISGVDAPRLTKKMTMLSKSFRNTTRTFTASKLALQVLSRTRDSYAISRKRRLGELSGKDDPHNSALLRAEILFRHSLMRAMRFLDYHDLARAGLVNKTWNGITNRYLRVSDEGFCEEENEWIRSQLGYNESFFLRSMVQYLCEAVTRAFTQDEMREVPESELLKIMTKVRQHHYHYATCPAVAMAMLNGEAGAHEKCAAHELVFRAKYSRQIAALSSEAFLRKTLVVLIDGLNASSTALETARESLEAVAEEEIRLQALRFYGDASSVDERCSTTAGIYPGDITAACRPYFTNMEARLEEEHGRACSQVRTIIFGQIALPRPDSIKGFEFAVPTDDSWAARLGILAIESMSDEELLDTDLQIFLRRNLPQLSVALVKMGLTARARETLLSESYLVSKMLAKLADLVRTCTPETNIVDDDYETLTGISFRPALLEAGAALAPEDLVMLKVESRVDEYLDYFIDQRWLECPAPPANGDGLPVTPDEVRARAEGWLLDDLCELFESASADLASATGAKEQISAPTAAMRQAIYRTALRRYIHHTLMKENARHGLNQSPHGNAVAPVSKRIELAHRLVPMLTEAAARDLGRSPADEADDFERAIFDDEDRKLLKILNAFALRELADLVETKRQEMQEYEKQSIKVD